MVRNTAVEVEINIITIKAGVKPATEIRHPRAFMGMLGRNPSTKMVGLGHIFKYEEKNSMVPESLGEYLLASEEVAYEETGEQALMVFMASEGEYHEYRNASRWLDQKIPSFTNHTFLENTNWDTVAVHTSVDKEAIIKAIGRVNIPLECWGYTQSFRYYADRFHTYRNCPKIWNQMWRSMRSGKFKSTHNVIKQWEGTGVPKESNTEEIIYNQPKHVPCLQIAGIIYYNRGKRRDLDR